MIGGICGWTGSGDTPDRARHLLLRMGPLLLAQGVLRATTGPDWALAAGSCNPGVGIHRSGRGAMSYVGRPRPTDASLEKQARDLGLAAALLGRYLAVGAGVLKSVGGHFAMAFHDQASKRFLVATDRAAVHPIYYQTIESQLIFATSLEALLVHPDVDDRISNQSIFDYLYFHVVPGPNTIYERVRRLEPGTYVEATPDGVGAGTYWQPRYDGELAKRATADKSEAFRQSMRDAVEHALEGAQRPGCFLSGGTDSSTVSGLVTQVAGTARTYSIGFAAEGYDEMQYARIAARHFRTEHHEYYVTAQDVVDAVPKIAQAYGQPFGNSSAVPTYYCAQMARQDGVDRLLGGDGGDELFGGNLRYAKQNIFANYKSIPLPVRRTIQAVLDAYPFTGPELVTKTKRYVEQANQPMPDRLESYNYMHMLGAASVLEEDFLSTVCVDGPLEHLRSVYHAVPAQTLINRMLGLDYKFTLADSDLRKVSTIAAVAGVDVAYPFLEEAVIEFANGLPADAKVRGRRLRLFFKEALADFLPAEIIAKRKQGFGLPFGVWLTTHEGLGELARDSLNVLAGRGIIRPTLINALLDSKLKEHAHYHGGLVWVLMMLEQWLRHHDRARQPANWPQPTSVELQILPQPRVGVAGGEA